MKLVTPEEVGFSSQRLARINAKMQRYNNQDRLNICSVTFRAEAGGRRIVRT